MPWKASRQPVPAEWVEVLNEPHQQAGVHTSNHQCPDGVVIDGAMKYIYRAVIHMHLKIYEGDGGIPASHEQKPC